MASRIKFASIFLLLFATLAAAFAATASPSYCQQGASPATNGIVYQYAPWYCSQANQAIAKQWSSVEPLAIIAVVFAFAIATIMLLAAQLLNNQKIRNFAVGEYYEAMATAIIVVFFLFITAVMVGLVPSLIIGTNPYVSSLSYISNTITNTQTMLNTLFNVATIDKQIMTTHIVFCTASLSLPINGNGAAGIQAPPQSSAPGTGTPSVYAPQTGTLGNSQAATIGTTTPNCNPSEDIADELEHAVNIFFYIPALTYINLQSDALGLLYGEFYMILIFMYAAIPVFLIPGIIFRAILPLRGLGGMMIAVAIGTYIIMPTLFSVAYYFTSPSLQSQLLSLTSSLTTYGGGAGVQLNAATPQSPLPQTMNLAQQGLGAYWMSVLFYPVLIFAMTYAMIVQIAQFLGNMTSMSGKLKII